MKNLLRYIKSRLRKKDTGFVPLSPRCEVRQQIVHTTISIVYKRPSARDRIVMGELVPFGQLWRTGAGRCTTIAFSTPVQVNGIGVPPGKYSLFTIPHPTEWVIILNKDSQLEGLAGYSAGQDLMRLSSPVSPAGRFYESFSIETDIRQNRATIYLLWERTMVSFTVEVAMTVDEQANRDKA